MLYKFVHVLCSAAAAAAVAYDISAARLRVAQLEAKSATLRGIHDTTAVLLYDTAVDSPTPTP